MSPGAEAGSIIGVNWGSTKFRAFRIAADGCLLDEYSENVALRDLGHPKMAKMVEALARRWPGSRAIYLSGMIGSNLGWIEVPYAVAPVALDDLASATKATSIGEVGVRIVPGVRCRRGFDKMPDILRGEEIELFGLLKLQPQDGLVVVPGLHTKWLRLKDGCIYDFFTSISGEILSLLSEHGLLASIVQGEARDGPAFQDGVQTGRKRKLGLETLLFGARARVLCGEMEKAEAASYIRGLLIGSEVADALKALPTGRGPISLIGNDLLCGLYASALDSAGMAARMADPGTACVAGFRALDEVLCV